MLNYCGEATLEIPCAGTPVRPSCGSIRSSVESGRMKRHAPERVLDEMENSRRRVWYVASDV